MQESFSVRDAKTITLIEWNQLLQWSVLRSDLRKRLSLALGRDFESSIVRNASEKARIAAAGINARNAQSVHSKFFELLVLHWVLLTKLDSHHAALIKADVKCEILVVPAHASRL